MRLLSPVPLLLSAGAVGTAVLTASLTGTLAGFTAQLTKSGVSTNGTVILKEVAGGVTCLSTDGGSVATNTASCTSINEFGAAGALLTPNSPTTTTVVLTNTGTATASSLQLASGGCTQSGAVSGSATDLCSKLTVRTTVTPSGGTATTTSTTLAALGTPNAVAFGSLAPNTPLTVKFEVSLPTDAGNTYQGLVATVPLTWTLSS